ncbi:MAG: excisionase [Lachnospiraceae bacterium]|nr:excisionase [Lachnospiraceae bacterium]
MEEKKIPVGGKYSLSIKEAADYFSIGTKKMRRLAEDHLGTFSAYNGNRYLIIRAEFEAYLKKSPIMQKPQEEGEELKRAQLEDKSIFNPEEAIAFYDLSRRRFKKLLEGEEELPFVAYFKKRKIIIRDEFEEYMEDHPEIMEEIKNGKARVS